MRIPAVPRLDFPFRVSLVCASVALIAASFAAAPGAADMACPMIGDELVLEPVRVEPESSVWLQELALANQTVLALLQGERVAIRLAETPPTEP